MAQLAIKGHATRGKEVIEILEMLGGKNDNDYVCDLTYSTYYITEEGIIDWCIPHSDSPLVIFTLEEFLEKFPYKVGDKVIVKGYKQVFEILSMRWCSVRNDMMYSVSNEWFYTEELQPYKEETMEENIIDTIKESADRYRIKVNYQFDIEVDEGEYYAVRRKSQYPKTYEESCGILNIPSDGNIAYVGNWVYGGEYLEKHLDRLRNFQKLLICRDAYWKITGEEMGLEKHWEYDVSKNEFVYAIAYQYGNIQKCEIRYKNHLLIFPTAEMRDIFYENFKELIELCKELL